ncbi:MAG: hypothetical protein M0Q21_05675 [Ignavibacteriaceae bacterium]|nr:hypothetical protein [Ignavibacteriaceae bacterium]
MKLPIFVFILVLFFAQPGCLDVSTPVIKKAVPDGIRLGEEFFLSLNKEITIIGEDLTIKFLSIHEDSRCPINVVCVWEGNAHIIVLLNKIDTLDLNTSLTPKEVVYKNIYKISLIEVQPYPISEQPIPIENYKVKLKVEKV